MLVLLLIFVLACSGAAALLDREPVLARLAAAVFYGWNPYVADRLIIGQWALLPAVVGGFAAMAITALMAVPVAVCTRKPRTMAVVVAALGVGSLPWLVPSVVTSRRLVARTT